MKLFFLALTLVVFVAAVPTQAQLNKTKTIVYVDSSLGGIALGSNAITAAAIARGFSGYVLLATDLNDANDVKLQWRWRGKTSNTLAAATSFTADTVRVQGLYATKSGSRALDTIWVDIPLTWEITGINTGAGASQRRDTTATVFTPVTPGMGNAEGYVSPIFTLPKGYQSYRIVNGKADSGRTVIRTTFEQVIK